ncbi:MAG: hypothetical protein ACTHMJ_21155 [Thermomicrobiales bacterium]
MRTKSALRTGGGWVGGNLAPVEYDPQSGIPFGARQAIEANGALVRAANVVQADGCLVAGHERVETR